ncbi:endonuclease/exonuclease/phosphatase family protein [Sphingobacterium phlebotomi]|nr:endonuclease/exonuclease/phosphatase family protein [Sphingobacterium phlebotomi]
MKLRNEKMKVRNITQLTFCMFLMLVGCKSSGEFDPGPFARENGEDKTLLTFNVTDASGEPIEGAYVVSYRQLAPKHIRTGEGYTDNQGEIQIEDQSHTAKGYATVTAPGYNSKRIDLIIEQKQENNISITLLAQDVLKVMSYNIQEGFKNNAQQRQKFAEWVQTYDPDIILVQEMMHFTDASFAAFAKTYGHDHAVLTKTVGIPTGITSKEPINNIRKVVQTGVLHHGYVTAETAGIRVFSIHLCPYELDNERNIYQIARKDEIKIIMDDAAHYTSVPVIIGGDLNDHNTFDRDSYGPGYRYGERDHTVTNTLKEYNFLDTYPLLQNIFKPTWPVDNVSSNGPNEGARLDYIFVSDNARNTVVYSDIIQSTYTDSFSDHYPTYIEIKKSTN